jgi:hypothetical protein
MVELFHDMAQYFHVGVVLVLYDCQEEFKRCLHIVGKLLPKYAIAA